MQVWSKSIHLFRRYRVGKPNLISFHGLVTLKMRSRSPKCYQLFPPSQPCIYASLVKIHPLVQKILRRKEAMRTPTRTQTTTGSAPKTICPPPSVGGFYSPYSKDFALELSPPILTFWLKFRRYILDFTTLSTCSIQK